MRSAKAFNLGDRPGLLVAALGTAILLFAPMAAIAGDKPATVKPSCPQAATADGHQSRPGGADSGKGPPDAAPGIRSGIFERPPIDADEAFILDVIRRYSAQP